MMAKSKQCLIIVFIVILASLSSACQITTPSTKAQINYSQYYLSLKSLSDKELLAAEKHLKILINNQHRDDQVLNQGKLILIYSLATASLHNPYKAKRLLNEHLLASDRISGDNFAFTMLLRDQLNSQLHLLEKQRTENLKFSKQSKEHHLLIEQLNQQLKQVNQQLILLKKIDQNINERG